MAHFCVEIMVVGDFDLVANCFTEASAVDSIRPGSHCVVNDVAAYGRSRNSEI